MKPTRLFSLCLTLLCFLSSNAYATHIMGASITWDHVGKDSFEVALKVYRDCTGIRLSTTPQLNVGCKTGSLSNVDTTRLNYNGGKDATPVCASTKSQCQSSSASFSYGVEEHVATYLVDLSNASSCCKVKFDYNPSTRRSNSITTGLSGRGFYVESWVDRCKAANDNSPKFTEKPGTILCKGNFYVGNLGAFDTDTTAAGLPKDSLSYKIVNPKSGPKSPLSFNNPYSHKVPFDYKGRFPNLPPPRGFNFDNKTGFLRFTPTKKQTSVIKIRVNEYQKSANGKPVKIGEVNRDIQIFVTNCPQNKNPSIKGMDCQAGSQSSFKTVCEGDLVVTDFCTNDSDSKDSVTLSFNKGNLPGEPSFKIKNPSAKYQTGQLTWRVPEGSARSALYGFTVSASDDNCPVPAQKVEQFRFRVKESPEKPSYNIKDLGCGRYQFTTTSPNSQTNVSVALDGKTFNKDSFVYKLDQPNQSYPVTIKATRAPCTKVIRDTIRTDSFLAVDFDQTDTTICPGNDIQVNASVRLNNGSVSYTWQDSVKNTTKRTFTNIQQDTTIWLEVKDDTCTATANLKVKVDNFSSSLVSFQDSSICTLGDSITAFGNDTSLSYNWSTGSTADSAVITDTGAFFAKVTKSNGCTNTDTFRVSSRVNSSLLRDSAFFCKGNSVSLTAQAGNKQATYMWNNNQTGPNLTVSSPGNYSVKASVDSNCQVRDTIGVQQVPNVKAGLRNDTSLCGADSLQLAANPGFSSYSWSTGDTTHQIWVANQGQYAVTVSNGVCSVSDTVQINFNNKPAINLGADTTICQTDSVQLSPKGGYASYSWSTGDTSRTIWANKQGQYTVTVTNAKGCTSKDTLQLTTLNDCVWPGDANNDGVANNQDILQIGVKYNVSGKALTNQGTAWQAYKADDWSDTFSSGLNTKFADCDGDGTVQTSDTQAVSQNYGQTHNKRGLEGRLKDGEAPIELTIQEEEVEPGETVRVELKVGTQDNQVQNLYGVAANLSLDPELIQLSQVRVEAQNSMLLDNDPNAITFRKVLGQEGRLALAVTRTDQQAVTDQGTVATIGLPIKEDTDGDTLAVSLEGEYPVDAQGQPVAYDRDETTVKRVIEGPTGFADEQSLKEQVQAYPNPTTDQLTVQVEKVNPEQAILLNAQGQRVMNTDLDRGSNQLSVKELLAGPYHLMVQTNKGIVQQTIVVK